MTLNFSINILETNGAISQKIANALIPQVDRYLDNMFNQIKNLIPTTIINSIMNQPEYASLLSGQLKAEFGLPDSDSRLSQILSTIQDSSNIVRKQTSITGGKISSGIRFQMIKSDFEDLVNLGAASFTTEKGSNLNWLKWLLTEGDSVIISDYQFIAGSYASSRTGMGIMRSFGGAFWRVPPEFAGTIRNNWITRAIDDASSDIEKQLENILRN
jgi:hypothetical protein